MGFLWVEILAVLILFNFSLTNAQICYSTGNFTTNSTYGKNRDLILSSLPSNVTSSGGFYTATEGQEADKVYAMALCRGDISSGDCYNCVQTASQEIINICTSQKEALSFAPKHLCIVRCANRLFFGSMEGLPAVFVWSTANITATMSIDQFNQILSNLIGSLVTRASTGSMKLKFATGETKLTDNRSIYVLMQCTPDLLESDCAACLQEAVTVYEDQYQGSLGLRIMKPSCILQYELERFYEITANDAPAGSPSFPSLSLQPPSATFSPPPITATTITRAENRKYRIVAAVVPITITLALVTIIYASIRLSKKDVDTESDDATQSEKSLRFKYGEIRAATNGFSDANKLGQGGFGSVYKGTLSNGQEIAVKRLAGFSTQGEKEFKNEIVLMAKLQHKNLVGLLGFCLEGRERLLIYEYMPNGSLDRFIFDSTKRAQMGWERRYKIIEGIARGILYLHEDSRLRIIHRDLKAGNVLLDAEMNPKIADFGMAKLFVADQSQSNTKRIAGTYGYMAPEYANFGKISVKLDVFSFGVLVLEILSGKKNSGYHNPEHVDHLLSIAWKNWKKGTALNLMDPLLQGGSRSEQMRCIQIGLLCVQENVAKRPTMASVLLMLNSFSTTTSLPSPSKPAFLMSTGTSSHQPLMQGSRSSNQSPHLSAKLSRNEVSLSELYPR